MHLPETSFLKQFERRYLKPWLRASCGGVEVHYKKHLDGGGLSFGQDFIPFLKSRNMPKQARVFEWCAGPGFIGFSMLGHGLCDSLCLADINDLAVTACERTIASNHLTGRVSVFQSDNLKQVPPAERWDLVVSNPPHFADEMVGRIKEHDHDWRLHREFFTDVGAHLNPGAVIVLQENNRGSTPETFRLMIEDAGLSIVFTHGCEPARTVDHRFYFIGVMRSGDPRPAWLQSSS
jgi:16S rRNA G966 N2-methylase RsmD